MATINIFEKKVSFFDDVKTNVPKGEATISRILEMRNQKTNSLIEEFRETGNEAIKKSLPCFTPSGTFTVRQANGLKEHTGVVCIDIDGKDNTEVRYFLQLKEFIYQIPYVAYCGLSCSGNGFFVLIPIEYPDKHREHCESIFDDFERCRIKVDRQCIDVSRLRLVSLDKDAYRNYEAEVYTKLKCRDDKKETISGNANCPPNFDSSSGKLNCTEEKVQKIIAEISRREIDITGEYNQWLRIGASLAAEFGERGRDYFHAVSRFGKSYHQNITNNQYTECLGMRNFTIGTFFHYAKQYGINY